MHIGNLELTMNAFDSVLDALARQAKEEMAKANGKNVVVKTYLVPASKEDNTVDAECVDCIPTGRGGNPRFIDILDDVRQVIYNDPATIVVFSDGSKVCVKACEKDTFNKETGLIYALVKRLYANDIDGNGYFKSKGLGEKINKLVKEATDQKENEKARRAERKAKQARKAEAEKKAKLANEVSEQAAKEAVEQIYEDDKKE